LNNYLFSGHKKYNLEIHKSKLEKYVVKIKKSKYSVNILENKDYSDYISVLINNTPYACVIKELDNKQICVNMQNYVFTFNVGNVSTINLTNNATDKNSELVPYYKVLSKVPGKISEICVKVGQNVKKGDQLMIIESMKMEAVIKSDHNGFISEIYVKNNSQVSLNQLLMVIETKILKEN
tara:strand:- start:35 stop:574 length:540 start_codon:yes stop_codon:yes gene_type:complete